MALRRGSVTVAGVLVILVGASWVLVGRPSLLPTGDPTGESTTRPGSPSLVASASPSSRPTSPRPTRRPSASSSRPSSGPSAPKPPATTRPVAALPRPGASGVVTLRLQRAVRALPVVAEDRQPYVRSLFGGWIDADGNCRDTRDEVLVRDSLTRVTTQCGVYAGRWLSYYDRTTWTKSFQVQIDHLVPLAEAWDSGAFEWNAATRRRYANDLSDPRTLTPVTTALNYAKDADDPSWWLPPENRCRYIREWVAVKLRWGLTSDQREHDAVARVATGCPNARISFRPARIGRLPFVTGRGTASRAVRIQSMLVRPSSGRNESVTLVNSSSRPVRLVGWVLSDVAGTPYRMPAWTLPARGTVVIHGGDGRNRAGNLYTGWGSVWNNSGDTAYLRDGRLKITDTCTYGDSSAQRVTC